MYTQKPYAFFGYVLIKNTYPAGKPIKVVVNADSVATLLWTKGTFTGVRDETGEAIESLTPGAFVTPDQYVYGTFTQTPLGETDVWCFDPKANRGFTPPLRKFELAAGETQILLQGTKLFLCEGGLVVNGNVVNKPTQIFVKTNDIEVTAATQVYGIIFE
jgi:hypothetical protein